MTELELPAFTEADGATFDGKAPCPGCGKYLTVNADGSLNRRHKCTGITEVANSTGKRAPAKRSRKQAPATVRKLGVNATASLIEFSTSVSVARYVPCETEQVPAELPDPDVMIGPFIDLLWPSIPDGAQKFIKAIADQEDLIVAFFAWTEYIGTLRKFAIEARKLVLEEHRRQQGVVNSVPFSAQDDGGAASPFVPFQPIAVSEQAV